MKYMLWILPVALAVGHDVAGRGIKLNSDKWKLVWSDEFDGTSIDAGKWSHIDRGDGFGNHELQYYTPRRENSFTQNGKLVIRAIKEKYKHCAYSSAKLVTKGKVSWKYGKFSFRARMPVGKGLWPAIWMMPEKSPYGGWPMCGEIDIVEYLGHKKNRVFGTLHYGSPWPNNRHSGKEFTLPKGDFHKTFHTFDLIWMPGEIQWFVDGKHYQTQRKWYTAAEGADWPAPYDQEFYLMLNLAVGGRLPGNPDRTTRFPQRFEVDYVRVYRYDGKYPVAETPMQKALAKVAPRFKLKGNRIVQPERGPADFVNDRVAVITHPKDQHTPAVLSRKLRVPRDKKTTLKIGVGHDPGQDWELRVKINNTTVRKQLVSAATTTGRWLDISIDLSPYAGKSVELTVENRAKGGKGELAYWSRLEVVRQ